MLKVGKVYMYTGPSGYKRPVYVYAGELYPPEGGISNFWTFYSINKNGTLGRSSGAYDDEDGKFVLIRGAKVVTKIRVFLPKKKEKRAKRK